MSTLLERLRAISGQPMPGQHKPPTPRPAGAPAPAKDPLYWRPVAVELHPQQVTCTCCGSTTAAAPLLFVREQQGHSVRLRRIYNPAQFSLLPRVQVAVDMSFIHTCEACFVPALSSPQLTLPFPEDLEVFRRGVTAGIEALTAHEQRVAAVTAARASFAAALEQPDLYDEPPEPFAFGFGDPNHPSLYYSDINGCRRLDDETTEQAIQLARRNLINWL